MYNERICFFPSSYGYLAFLNPSLKQDAASGRLNYTLEMEYLAT